MSLRTDLLDFVRNERGGIDRGMLCVELARLGSSGVWSKATAEQWSKEIDQAIIAGELIVDGSKVSVPIVKAESSDRQGFLF